MIQSRICDLFTTIEKIMTHVIQLNLPTSQNVDREFLKKQVFEGLVVESPVQHPEFLYNYSIIYLSVV